MRKNILTQEESKIAEVASVVLPSRKKLAQWPDSAKVALLTYARTGIRVLAFAAADVHASNLTRWRRDLPGFRRAWKRARGLAKETLEVSAMERAIHGPTKEVWFRGEHVGNSRGVPSDLLMMFLLKGLDPDKYKERSSGEIKHTGDILGLKGLVEMNRRLADKEEAVIGGRIGVNDGNTVDGEFKEVSVVNA